jgi:hypothetical protein
MTDLTPGLVPNVNSDSYFIRRGWLARLQLIPPFNTAAKVTRTNARPTQVEHIPFLGCYFMTEQGGPDGDPNVAEPRFVNTLKLGFSWIILNNDSDAAEDKLDQAHWAFMKLLHDPAWKDFDNGIRVEAITEFSRDMEFGSMAHNNETPIAELRMEITLVHRTTFAPIIDDAFDVFHMTTSQAGDDPAAVKPVITVLNLPQ